MAILDRDKFFERVQEIIGEGTDDRHITFLEDMTDTFNDMERRIAGDGENWEQKYRDLDDSWRKKYRHRFFTGGDRHVVDIYGESKETEEYDPNDVSVETLFEEKKD